MGFLQLFIVAAVAFVLATLALQLRKYVTLSSALKAKTNEDLVKALRPMIEPRVKKQGLVWKDITPILSEFKSKQDFLTSASQPKVFLNRIAAAGGPVAQKVPPPSLASSNSPTGAHQPGPLIVAWGSC